MVGVAIGDPVLEIGPAPPRAASQTMISYWALPLVVEEVNMSYATSATMLVPVYDQDHFVGTDPSLLS